MAQKVQVRHVCDLHDNEVDGEQVSFALDGSSYEIDVCPQHAAELRDSFAPYVGAARRASRPGSSSSGPRKGRAAGRRDDRVVQIREWARNNGHQVSERGRLSASLVEAYEAAHR